MTTQPEALRLAQELDAYHTRSCHKEAAAELRRLHAENEVMRNVANRGGHIAVAMSRIADLEAQRDALLEALKLLLSYTLACEAMLNAKPAGQIDIARAAIKAAEETK
jgi:hypothetical protein